MSGGHFQLNCYESGLKNASIIDIMLNFGVHAFGCINCLIVFESLRTELNMPKITLQTTSNVI